MLVRPGLAYHRPTDPEGVTALLATLGPEARILAGGTDLVVQMRGGRLTPRHLVDVGGVASLDRVTLGEAGELSIGATTRVTDLITHLRRAGAYDALVEGALCVGSRQIQNQATIIGNLCNASPAADTVPALLAYGARVAIGGSGLRTEPVETFLVAPGRTTLGPGDWVSGVDLPAPGRHGSAYVKLGRTRGVDIAVVGAACVASAESVRLAFASVGPTAILVDAMPAGATMPDDVAAAIAGRIHPIDDVRASGTYRAAMAVVLARAAWAAAHARLAASDIR